MVPLCQFCHDLLECLFSRRGKINLDTESCNKGQFFLHSIICMQFFIPILFVTESLPHQMPSVGSCIDQNIVWFFLQTSFDHGFQILIFDFKFFKREIIHVNNKFIVSIFNLGNHLVQILKLMLIYFDHAKPLIIILI